MTDLTWHRRNGGYSTPATGVTEFIATADFIATGRRTGEWLLVTSTFRLSLSSAWFRTLAEAKAEAQRTFDNVDSAAS